MSERGKYVVIEGHDGTGKSTQVKLVRERLANLGVESVEFHEPEGTPISNRIRTIIKDATLDRDPITNLLLFTAARHEIWNRARREMALGTWVVNSRNYFSTLAYQGHGEGLDLALIEETTRRFTDDDYMQPDLAVILSLEDKAERQRRIDERGALAVPDTFESKGGGFQQAVNDGYLAIAHERHLPVISALGTPKAICEEIFVHVEGLLKKSG